MKRARVIPVLLLKGRGLYKTIRFKNERYVGDPINAVRIFNEKQCDELILLDIEASKQKKEIDFNLIGEIASECFMPLSYGGGINEFTQIEKLLKLGIEKVVLNSVLFSNPSFLSEAVKRYGSSTIVASIDVKMNLLRNYQVYSHSGGNVKGIQFRSFLKNIEDAGVGEIMINAVDRDGLMNGFDLYLSETFLHQLSVPVVFCGGCGSLIDIEDLLRNSDISAAAAGSCFVFHGPHKAVLITYPSPEEIEKIYI